jgi:hypothetical protein
MRMIDYASGVMEISRKESQLGRKETHKPWRRKSYSCSFSSRFLFKPSKKTHG